MKNIENHKSNPNEKRRLIQDDKVTLRNNWRKEKVKEWIVSRDSKICDAVLPVYNKKKDDMSLMKIAVQRLILLEIMNSVREDSENVPNFVTNRQQRKTAVKGKSKHRVNHLSTTYV